MQTKSCPMLNDDEQRFIEKQLQQAVTSHGGIVGSKVIPLSSPMKNISNLINSNSSYTSTPVKSKDDISCIIGSPITPKCNGGILVTRSPVTPKRSNNLPAVSSPATPSYNMKLLTNIAANLDYAANKDNEKEISLVQEEDSVLSESSVFFVESTFNSIKSSLTDNLEGEPLAKRSRREKSITVICEKFVSQFPEYMDDGVGIPISITQAAIDLGVEKRRIYDIVNILESVKLVEKIGKDTCRWHGRNKLLPALVSLKNTAIKNGIGDLVKSAIEEHTGYKRLETCQDFTCHISSFQYSLAKKEKSLTALTQQFLSLFLSENEPFPVPLEVAAFIIAGDSSCMELCKKGKDFKTKVRRLYDIANVLVTLKILKRSEKMFGKPTFQYTGPVLSDSNLSDIPLDLDYAQEVRIENLKSLPINKDIRRKLDVESSKQDYFKNLELLPVKRTRHRVDTTSFARTKSENWDKSLRKSKKTSSFVRHSSLQEICAVASTERAKLFSPNFLNENSNDSCMSFFSFSSIESSSIENLCDSLSMADKIDNSIEQKLLLPEGSVSSADNGNKLEDSTNLLIDHEVRAVEPKEDSEKSLKSQKIVKLSSNQQKLVLETLKLSFEKTQIALLLTPEEKEQHSKKEVPSLQDTSKFKIWQQVNENSAESKNFQQQSEDSVFKDLSNTVTDHSTISKCNITSVNPNGNVNNSRSLLIKNVTSKSTDTQTVLWKPNASVKMSNVTCNRNSNKENQSRIQNQLSGTVSKDKNIITAIPVNLISNNSFIKPSTNFMPIKISHPTVVKLNTIPSTTTKHGTVFTIIPCSAQENVSSMLTTLPSTKTSQPVPFKLIYKSDVQKK